MGWVSVVENKIFSNLNGKRDKDVTQLDKYHNIITRGNGQEKNKYKNWNNAFVLLTSDHNDIDIQGYTQWAKIHYSEVSNFLTSTIDDFDDIHLKDFAEMIRRHSSTDYSYEVMKRRFETALRNNK